MPSTQSNQEIEIKLRVPDAAKLRNRLKRLQAREIVPRTHESNTLYDTSAKSLTRRGQLIRVRIEQPASKGKGIHEKRNSTAILTYKGPFQISKNLKKHPGKHVSKFKIREEVEVALADGEQMARILNALGLIPVFRYEKFRTTYILPDLPKVKVEFDETPAGLFLELEGNVVSIDRAARFLGYCRTDYMTETYGALYIADCRKRGIKPADMLFSQTKQK